MKIISKLFINENNMFAFFFLFCLILQSAQMAEAKNVTLSEKDGKALADAGNLQAASDYYANLGELLVRQGIDLTPSTAMFEKALKFNPNNQKALFYSAVTKPILAMQGIITRVGGIKNKANPDFASELCKRISDSQKVNSSTLYSLTCLRRDGDAIFNDFHDLQRFLRVTMLPLISDSADKLQKVAYNKPLSINMDSELYSQLLGARKDDPSNYSTVAYYICKKDVEGYWQCEINSELSTVPNINSRVMTTISIQEVDLKVLRGSLLAFADFMRIFTAYNLTGLEKIIDRISDLNEASLYITAKEFIETIKQHKNISLLESDHQLAELNRTVGATLQHAMDLDTLSDDVCQATYFKIPSKHFLRQMFCTEDSFIKDMQFILDLVAGPQEIELGLDKNRKPVTFLLDITPIFKNPPHDIKALLPTKFDNKGNAIDCPDQSFGGIFPENDICDKIKSVPRRKLRAVR